MATSSFDYKFVSPVPEEYMCPICQCPMKEPVQTKCGHRFCKHCLGKAMRRTPECPIDRTPLSSDRRKKDIYPDVASKRTIMDYRVRCSNEGDGCSWIGELRSVEKHGAGCSFTRVKCTNENCESTPLKSELHRHVTKECPRRTLECIYCRTSYVWCLRQTHIDKCETYPCSCLQKCGLENIPRNEMSDHIKKVCPRTEVDCSYSYVGCPVKIQRSALSQHVNDNVDSHLSLACVKLQLLQAEIVDLNINVQELSAAVPRNESLQDVWENVLETKKEMQTLQEEVSTNEAILNLQAEVATTNQDVQTLRSEIAASSKIIQNLKAQTPSSEEMLQQRKEDTDGDPGLPQDLSAVRVARGKKKRRRNANNSINTNTNSDIAQLQLEEVQGTVATNRWLLVSLEVKLRELYFTVQREKGNKKEITKGINKETVLTCICVVVICVLVLMSIITGLAKS